MPGFTENTRPDCFVRQLNGLEEKYPGTESEVAGAIKSLLSNPFIGDRLQGFGTFHVRKMRIGLKSHNMSKSDGLRCVFMIHENLKILTMIAIWKKGFYKKEADAAAMIRVNFSSTATTEGAP